MLSAMRSILEESKATGPLRSLNIYIYIGSFHPYKLAENQWVTGVKSPPKEVELWAPTYTVTGRDSPSTYLSRAVTCIFVYNCFQLLII